jgi:hypothetical protein
MKSRDFSTAFRVEKSPAEIFRAVQEVREWWTRNLIGETRAIGDEFEVRFGNVHYSRQKLVEVIPHQKVVWLVNDSRLNFLSNKKEWTGTRVSFEIRETGSGSELTFTHHGLVPGIECYEACSGAWTDYIQKSLRNLITTGFGEPEDLDAQ